MGFRKAGAVIANENGATPHQLMSIFGWRTLKEAERYTKAVQQKKVAAGAMNLFGGRKKRERNWLTTDWQVTTLLKSFTNSAIGAPWGGMPAWTSLITDLKIHYFVRPGFPGLLHCLFRLIAPHFVPTTTS